MTEFVVVIPCRYASTRLPGKPLRDINGEPMLQHVFRRATESAANDVIIATDDERIADAAEGFGARVCMTGDGHQSGTDRIAEVCDLMDWADDRIVVNLQGDEPMMPAQLINQCAGILQDRAVHIGTLASPLASQTDFADPNVVKVIIDKDFNAIYFSRAAIPHPRAARSLEMARGIALHHHGIYAYRCGVLRQFVAAEPSGLEQCEQLEQLRALYLGLTIRIAVPVRRPGAGVDTESDLLAVARAMAAAGNTLG
jgi:3-deoxy-manno-octulosonate cytidylyltransferase (CMP-KDO synthetase)